MFKSENKNSFIKSQTDFANNSNLNSKNSNLYSPNNMQNNLATREMNNLIKKIQFDGDITNLKGRMKKN